MYDAVTDPPLGGTVIVPLSELEIPDVEVQTYLHPDPHPTGLDHEKVCDDPDAHVNVTGNEANV